MNMSFHSYLLVNTQFTCQFVAFTSLFDLIFFLKPLNYYKMEMFNPFIKGHSMLFNGVLNLGTDEEWKRNQYLKQN